MTSAAKLFPSIQKTLHAIQQTNLDRLLHQPVGTMSEDTVNAIKNATRQLSTQCSLLLKDTEILATQPTTELLDSDLIVHDELEQIKECMRGLRRAILHLQSENWQFLRNAVLNDSLQELQQKVAQSYKAATELQWEIGEHDANNAPRTGPLIASTQDELDRILTQIGSKK